MSNIDNYPKIISNGIIPSELSADFEPLKARQIQNT